MGGVCSLDLVQSRRLSWNQPKSMRPNGWQRSHRRWSKWGAYRKKQKADRIRSRASILRGLGSNAPIEHLAVRIRAHRFYQYSARSDSPESRPHIASEKTSSFAGLEDIGVFSTHTMPATVVLMPV